MEKMERSGIIKQWSEMYRRPVSETEYDEICHNLKGFFGILHEWNKEDRNGGR